ncbi:MAG: hypothetical protein JHD35_13895, partial [Sphingopyxis sp.]|nr:hypothetical protein [Sphingopyxis sp.]
ATAVENRGAAFTAVATDADGDAVTYSLSGADAALFDINATTGVVTFKNAPDFERPADANRDNVFDVVVTASDGRGQTTQAVAITLTNAVNVDGTVGDDSLTGTAAVEEFSGDAGNDRIETGGGSDTVATGAGNDTLVYSGDPFEGTDVSAAGRQVVQNEDFVSDFSIANDKFEFDARDFGVVGDLRFHALDGNAAGAAIPAGANVIVLLNSDNDANPATPFNAGAAANQVANLVTTDGAGFFVYFNSALGVNRVVFSSNLNDPAADLRVVARFTDLTGQAAIDALKTFDAKSFAFRGEVLTGTAAADTLSGFGGDDRIEGLGGLDTIRTGGGKDSLVYAGDPFDGVDVSAAGRQVVQNEDVISDFSFANDHYEFNARDYKVAGDVNFFALDGNAPGAAVPAGANVIVLLNGDNDDNAATPFNAGAAANQVASLVSTDGAGFFVYFNSVLGVNRLVYSSNLNDPAADLKVISRQSDLTGADAIAALRNFSAQNFQFVDINNAPVITSAPAFNAIENRTTAFTATASDADGNPVTFSLSGADADLFNIDARTGVVTFKAAPDFEAPTDGGSNNVYDLIVTASDGRNSTSQAVTVTVTDAANVTGTDAADSLIGSDAVDEIAGLDGDDRIEGGRASDTVSSGAGRDTLVYRGDPFEGADVSAAGRQIIGNEDFVTDFSHADDKVAFNARDFGVRGDLIFSAVDGAVPGAAAAPGANVVILLNSDNDANPATPFNAGTAANLVATLVSTDGPGFFVYHNSALGVNRLVFSSNLNDPAADLKIVARFTDLTGADAIQALQRFTADNFALEGETLTGTGAADTLAGFGGDDRIEGLGGSDAISTGGGRDTLVFAGDPFDGADVSAAGRQIVGNEDFVADFSFTADRYELNARDFKVAGDVNFIAVDGSAPGASVAAGANVIVLLNNDNDANPATPFNAGVAANLVASLVSSDGAGFFVYHNSVLGVNRLVYSANLNDPAADLKIVARQTDLTGADAIAALGSFSAQNFQFVDINNAPVITSAAAFTASENRTTAFTATATDADGNPLTFSLSGADADLFNVNAQSGVVTFKTAPDFEGPVDAGANNVYDVVVTASDGRNSTNQAVTITVTDTPNVTGTGNADDLLGSDLVEELEGLEGDDRIEGGRASDTITAGAGGDTLVYRGDPFEGADVSAAGRQTIGNEDFVTDFSHAEDKFAFNARDYGIRSDLIFSAVDGAAPGAAAAPGANVVVLLNNDNDANPATPFNAGTAANLVATLVASDGPGFFVYHNSVLGVNRLVFSTNLNDPAADLKIVARFTDLTGADAIQALQRFSSDNFVLEGETLTGTDAVETISGFGGNDRIESLGGSDAISTGGGRDTLVFAGDPFAGSNASDPGRQVIGNEDFISDFAFASDRFELDAQDHNVAGSLEFAAIDANAPGASVPAGTNLIVLLSTDNDANPATAFNAGVAANVVAGLVSTDGAGFFVYHNSGLGVNRLVYSANLNDPAADLKVVARFTDLTGQAAIDALANFQADNFSLKGEIIVGTGAAETLTGFGGDDLIFGGAGADTIVTGGGHDTVAYDRLSVGSAPDALADFDVGNDKFRLDAIDFGVSGPLKFQNALAADLVDDGSNIIVLQDSDNDGNAATPFNARSAAQAIGAQVDTAGPGFFVYYNSVLDLNRLVFSADLADGNAPLTILGAVTGTTGQAAIEQLVDYKIDNFEFAEPEAPLASVAGFSVEADQSILFAGPTHSAILVLDVNPVGSAHLGDGGGFVPSGDPWHLVAPDAPVPPPIEAL